MEDTMENRIPTSKALLAIFLPILVLDREKVQTELGKLIGLKLRYAGRASNLFWLGFGDMVLVKRRKETEQLTEYSLHIQCAWRITKGNKILIASRDFYYPNSKWDDENGDFD